MILGLGNDLCDIRRVEESLERFGERFIKRCFTEVERAKSEKRAQRAPPPSLQARLRAGFFMRACA